MSLALSLAPEAEIHVFTDGTPPAGATTYSAMRPTTRSLAA